MSVVVVDMSVDVQRGLDAMTRRAVAKTAFQIMALARYSIVTEKGPSYQGTPPHTHPRLLRQSIAYKVDRNPDTGMWSAVIGPQSSVIGEIGNVHEFGGEYKGEWYPARPFMAPAMETGIDYFAASFGGSLGE